MPIPTPQVKADFAAFDPGAVAVDNGNIFSLPCSVDDASVVILPVPWEATVSYRAGTAAGPEALRRAALQVDLFDEEMGDVWRYGIHMPPHPADMCERGASARRQAAGIIEALARGENPAHFAAQYAAIKGQFDWLYSRIEADTIKNIKAGKISALAGGDHSVTLGALRAYASQFDSFGVLHIDAHADLRNCYEGFEYSHASIMYNALDLPQIQRLVQVGVRDFSRDEAAFTSAAGPRVRRFSDASLKNALFSGKSWHVICDDIIATLPELVYVSFDIDGLDPSLCPATGTPVPGGLTFSEAQYLLKEIYESRRKIIGFDLVEVVGSEGHDTWDAIVGARLLYQLCGWAIKSCTEPRMLG